MKRLYNDIIDEMKFTTTDKKTLQRWIDSVSCVMCSDIIVWQNLLYICVMNDQIDLVKYIFDQNHKLTTHPNTFNKLLQYACNRGNLKLIEILLNYQFTDTFEQIHDTYNIGNYIYLVIIM